MNKYNPVLLTCNSLYRFSNENYRYFCFLSFKASLRVMVVYTIEFIRFDFDLEAE